MNRRTALVTIGLTAFGGVAWSITRPRLLQTMLGQGGLAASSAPSKEAIDDRLKQDLARLSPLVYSEEGIPMFLACENLVPGNSSSEPPKVALTSTNAALASAFQRDAEAWLRIHPDAKGKDVAKLIEVLADRDFTEGGKGEL